MSLADAQADIASALEMLQESGEQAVFSYQTDPVFDDDTGDLISGGTSGTQIAYGYPESYSNSEIDGTNIQRGDIKLICSAGALAFFCAVPLRCAAGMLKREEFFYLIRT